MTSRLRLSLAAATILGTSSIALPALAASAFDPNAGAVQAAAPGQTIASPDLRRFALEDRELSFDGENRRLDFPFFVTAGESASPSKIVLNFDNAISVLPENSRMTVLVNDTVVAETPLGRAGRQSVTADLPGGLLQPGFNGMRILVEQHHRVDCSLAGTYELWTKLDSATSGLVFEGAPKGSASLAELPAIPPAADGRVHLRGIVGPGASGTVIDATMSAVQAAVLLGYFDAPVVDFSDKPGLGAGLDVVVGTTNEVADVLPDARGNTSIPYVTLLPAEDGQRQTLVVSGVTSEDVRRNLADLVSTARAAKPAGPEAGQSSLAMFQGRSVGSGETVSLAELGADTRAFSGRLYRDDFRFILPADFYAADYDYASITLDASFAAGLSQDAQMIIRANDSVVTTLSLGSSKSGQISRQRMRVPLQKLKPGVNIVSMEAMVPNASDAACEAGQIDPQIRFGVAGTSSFTMPNYARVGHAPDISAMAAGIAEANRATEKSLTVLVPGYDRPLLGAAATFVAKIASATRRLQPVRTVGLMPLDLKDDLLAFGSMSSLPPQIFSTIRVAQTGGASDPVASAQNAGSQLIVTSAAAATGEPVPRAEVSEEKAAAPAPETSIGSDLHEMLTDSNGSVGWALGQLRDFASAQTAPKLFVPSSEAALTVAQMPSPNTPSSTWTMVTAPAEKRIVSGVVTATERTRWAQLGGAVSEVSAKDGVVAVHEATSERLYETQPRSFSNARLVLAGWFSRHIEQYLVALIGTLLMLGFATALFLRGIGEKNS